MSGLILLKMSISYSFVKKSYGINRRAASGVINVLMFLALFCMYYLSVFCITGSFYIDWVIAYLYDHINWMNPWGRHDMWHADSSSSCHRHCTINFSILFDFDRHTLVISIIDSWWFANCYTIYMLRFKSS